MKRILFLAAGFFALSSQASEIQIPPILDPSALDTRANPCENFYEFACGQWLKDTVIPADKTAVSRQITALSDSTDGVLNSILRAGPKTKYAPHLTHFYQSCMNSDSQTQASLAVFHKTMDDIAKSHGTGQLAQLIAELHLLGTNVLFSFGSGQDMNDSSKVIGFIDKGGMGLPDRRYYLDQDSKSLDLLSKYKDHIYRIFKLVGRSEDDARAGAQAVIAFETKLAENSYTREDSFDPAKTNHPIGLDGLKKLAPRFGWDAYFAALGIPGVRDMNVSEPEFFQGLDSVLQTTSESDLRANLEWQYAIRSAQFLGGEFDAERFRFWGQIFSGQKIRLPRWKDCTQAVEAKLGYALAEAYVQTINGEAIKAKATQYSILIRDTFARELESLLSGPDAWLDQPTYAAALEKLKLLGMKIGAPDVFRNYDSLRTGISSYLENDQNVSIFETKRDLAKIGRPFDKSEWGMMPWEVNAYYNPPTNEFVFPFGILQPPSFDINANDGVNLGAFGGGTIGHELTHGFDHDGHQYDGYGNIRNWWTDSVAAKFDQKNQCYVDQSNHYRIDEVGLNVNGKQTLTEVVADNGGVKLGYLALQSILKTRPAAPLWLGKYTEAQQYWIAYGQSWCTKRTPESLRNLIQSNEHAPEEFRVNGVVMNRPEFAHDFGCAVGAPMAPKDRCSLW